MEQSGESSISWQYTKGVIISYAALATSLIKAGTVTANDIIKELDVFINTFTEQYPDSIAIIETMKMTKDAVLKLNPIDEELNSIPLSWLSNFIGHA